MAGSFSRRHERNNETQMENMRAGSEQQKGSERDSDTVGSQPGAGKNT
jgi:hypothetical protein